MRRYIPAIAFVAALLAVGAAVAQSTGLRILPAPLTINQRIPTTVTLSGIVDGRPVTLTAPVTVNVAMQITIDGATASASAGAAAAPAATPTPLVTRYDTRNVPYRIETPAQLEVLSITSSVNVLDRIEVIAEVRNAGSQELRSVQAIVTFYKDGKITGVANGYSELDRLAPGQSSPVRILAYNVAGDAANAYLVQMQARTATP